MDSKGVTTQIKALMHWQLSHGVVHVVAEQSSWFCKFYGYFGQKNMALKGLSKHILHRLF